MNEVEMNRCFAGARKVPAAGRGTVALLLLFSALSADALTDTATGLVYEKASGEATVTGYTGAGGHVAIPATLDGYSVTVVGVLAFNNKDTITSVAIPDSVRLIDRFAFFDCDALPSITIPDSVQSIGGHAFQDCGKLESVEIGAGVTTIGSQAFLNCEVLLSITIPDSVRHLGNQVFQHCTALEAVYFEGNAPSLGGTLVFYNAPVTIYYLPGTSGWGSMFGGRPTALDDRATRPPQILDAGVRDGGRFGFNVQGMDGQEVVVEASDDLPGGVWTPVSTNTIPAAGSISFEEATVPESRFYRARSS